TREQAAHGLTLSPGLDEVRLNARYGLLQRIEAEDRVLQQGRSAEALGGFYEQAFRMLTSPAAKRASNLDLEPPARRARYSPKPKTDGYGAKEAAPSCLPARRLIEAGVRRVAVIGVYVTESGVVPTGWANHGGPGSMGAIAGNAMLKEKYCIPPRDRGYSALI